MPRRKTTKGDGDDQRIIDFGRPERHPPFADNSVTTSKYSLLSFFPLVSVQNGEGSVLSFGCLKALLHFSIFSSI